MARRREIILTRIKDKTVPAPTMVTQDKIWATALIPSAPPVGVPETCGNREASHLLSVRPKRPRARPKLPRRSLSQSLNCSSQPGGASTLLGLRQAYSGAVNTWSSRWLTSAVGSRAPVGVALANGIERISCSERSTEIACPPVGANRIRIAARDRKDRKDK